MNSMMESIGVPGWKLAEPGVNHFHAGIAQGAGNDFGAAVVAVEAGLGNQYTDFAVGGHDEPSCSLILSAATEGSGVEGPLYRLQASATSSQLKKNHKPWTTLW